MESTSPPTAVPRLQLTGITKAYPGVIANSDVSLTVLPGQTHAVLGENGAGKSTLMKIIYGSIKPDAGQVLFNGKPANIRNPKEARALGISMVFQHFNLFDTITVAENVWLGLDKAQSLEQVTASITAKAADDAGVAALVITPSTGGVLAHALLLQPAAAVTALTNTQARVRILSALPTNLSVAGTVNGATLPLLGTSPSFGSYALVPAGTSTPQVTVNGGTLTGAAWTAAPGSDTTLFVWGTAAAPQFATLSDDNRLPGSSSAARIRLLHGLGNLTQDLTLNIAGAAVTTASQGGMSPVTAVSAVTDTTLSVTSSSTAASVYELTGKTLDANGVYSVFLLGDSSLPSGNGLTTVVVKER